MEKKIFDVIDLVLGQDAALVCRIREPRVPPCNIPSLTCSLTPLSRWAEPSH